MEENMQHFWHIMLYYFKKGKNTIEMQKKKDWCSVWRRFCDWLNMSKVVGKFPGATNTLAKEFFAVELSYALEDV